MPSSKIAAICLGTRGQARRCRGIPAALKSASRRMSSQEETAECMSPQVTVANMNQRLVRMEYAMRGPLLARAVQLEKELYRERSRDFWSRGRPDPLSRVKCPMSVARRGVKKPFECVLKANTGDRQALGQFPVTFVRQVLACVTYPALMETDVVPIDVKERAKCFLKSCAGCSVGAYTEAPGLDVVRRDCAMFIARRDQLTAHWQNILLSNGATEAIRSVLKVLVHHVDSKPPGVMIPIPQHPLYSATLTELGIKEVHYHLNESWKWSVDFDELERAYDEAVKTVNIRAIVVINPGNPTGQVFNRDNIACIIKFAFKYNLLVLADEVCQHNIHDDECQFHSVRKVAANMGPPCSQIEMASFYSISKGYAGECGLRGGYVELYNIDHGVQSHLYKAISAKLCPTTIGQCALQCVIRPPLPGKPSHAQWLRERCEIDASLKERAQIVNSTLRCRLGFKLNPIQGSLYAFPQIFIPKKAKKAAAEEGKTPDEFYAFRLLESTGICVVPGTAFGQRKFTHHIRITIVPKPEVLQCMLDELAKFQLKFEREYS